MASTSSPQFGFLPFDLPVETQAANAAACSGAHFCARHSRSMVAREAQARSASSAAAAAAAEEVEVEVDDSSPPLIEIEFAATHAA